LTQVSPTPSISGSASIRQIPSGNGGQAGFSLALVAPPGLPRPQVAPTPAPAPEAREIDPKRHQVAGPGKDLPEQDESADDDKDRTAADTPFAWFSIPIAPPEAAPAPIALGKPVVAVELPEGEAAPLPAAALPELTDPIAAEAPTGTEHFQLPEIAATEAPAPLTQIADIARPARGDAPARIELAAKIMLPADSPVLQTIAALQPRGESQPLAALAASAGIELPDQFRRPAPRDPVISNVAQPGTTEILRPHVVQSVADAQQAAIDTRRSEWMSQTIDRIEALRDAPNARETSIRLSPDALGKVDVSIRHEGDRIHVRFTAETVQARTLLTEAQSRLTEIAEARGIKLGSASVDAGVNPGAGGQGQREDAAPRTANASAPASAPGSETTTATDARVA